MTTDEIEIAIGKSATIVSSSQLAVNVGSRDGVRVGDAATVRRTVVVKDPDTNEELGEVHLIRVNLRVTETFPSFSVATVTDLVPATSTTRTLAGALESTRVRRRKTLVRKEFEATDSSVYVSPGESVIVTRATESDDELPGGVR